MYVLLPLVFMAALFGFLQMASLEASLVLPPGVEVRMVANGQLFVSYRNAVLAYVMANPAFIGSVPVSSLTVPPIPSSLPEQGNQVVATPSGLGRIVYVWAALPAGAAGEAVQATGGDLSYGTVAGATWVSPIGGNMGTLGVAITNGDVVSVSQIGK